MSPLVLLKGVLAATVSLAATGIALAQAETPSAAASSDDPFYFSAERALYDGRARQVRLEGKVEVSSGGRILLAERVVYDEATGKMRAEGGVTIIEEGGRSVTASSIELTGDLKDGIVENIGLIFDENTRLGAASATRSGGTVTTLERAIFSPCRICKETGEVTPLWQIRAVKIVYDQGQKTVSYESATFDFMGAPLLTIPAFSHADPAQARVSGFLAPRAGSSSDVGYFIQVPYYWAMAPSYDLTVSPLFATEANPVLFAEWRQRIWNGEYVLSGSYTYDDDRDTAGNPLGTGTSYSHIFGAGRFRIGEEMGWGFDLARVSDDTYLERYDISNADRLTSRVFVHWRRGLSSASVSAYAFQGLRQSDDPGTTPLVAPWVEFTHYLNEPWLGGAVRLQGSLIGLTRARGADTSRASVSADWKLPLIFAGGQALDLFALVRGDGYYTRNNIGTGPDDGFTGRVTGLAGASLRWPFIRTAANGTIQILEPVVQAILAPYGGNPDTIPNEDSVSLEFDDTNLFSTGKFPGLDRWESGPRLEAGLRYAEYFTGGGWFEVMAGAEFRLKESGEFPASTGLGGRRSDYVSRVTLVPWPGLTIVNRMRFDERDFSIRRNEIYVQGSGSFYSVDGTYLKLASANGIDTREEIDVRGRINFYDYWSVIGAVRRDLDQERMIESRFGIAYEDECSYFELGFRRRFTRDRDAEPGTTVIVSVRLKALGDDTDSPDFDPYLQNENRDLRVSPEL